MRPMWRRLRQMPAPEVTERAVMAAWQTVDRWSWHARRPGWNRSKLASALTRSSLGNAVPLLARGDFGAAHAELSAHFASRPQCFVISPASRDNVARLIRARFPSAAADAERRADRAVQGCLDVLGYRGVSFTHAPRQPIDWSWDPVHNRRPADHHWSRIRYLDPAIGDHKIIWELNRHQHWLGLGRAYWLSGDQRYRTAFIEQLQGWMAANPPRTGINWASMLELGLRVISWIWALHLFVEPPVADGPVPVNGEPPWMVDLLLGIDAQLKLVERHLSTYFSPNTHLLGEALALYVAGRALPEMGAARRWADTGRRILMQEATRQIHGDGGHVELSTHYHRYALDFYSLALAVARITRDRHAVRRFADAVRRLTGYARALSDRHFHLPQIGDDDGGMLFTMCGGEPRAVGPAVAVASALLGEPDLADGHPHEELAWMIGTVPASWGGGARRGSTLLAHSGYVVSRSSRGDHLVMDVGPLGYLNAGHAHADALSLTLNVGGQPLLIDPGTGGYTVDPDLRDRLRSTAAHNTVMLDNQWQSQPDGPFHWRSQAGARLEACDLRLDHDFIEATHDGYGEGGHRRQVLSRPGCWIVIDWVSGAGARAVAAHWHLDPGWRVRIVEPGRAALTHASGAVVWMLTSYDAIEAHTKGHDGLGWWAPAYGALQPTTTLRVAVRATPPFALVTAFIEDLAPVMEPLTTGAAEGPSPEPLAFRIAGTGWQDTVVAAGPTPGGVDGAPFGVNGTGRLLCARAAVPVGGPRSVLAATR
jgi:hypothetical protein